MWTDGNRWMKQLEYQTDSQVQQHDANQTNQQLHEQDLDHLETLCLVHASDHTIGPWQTDPMCIGNRMIYRNSPYPWVEQLNEGVVVGLHVSES